MFTTIAISVLVNAILLTAFYFFGMGPRLRGDADPRGLESLKSELADLLTDLNHVANTHVNAIESRKEELVRVLEAANRKIVRINSLISDLQIMEGRLSGNRERRDNLNVRETDLDLREISRPLSPERSTRSVQGRDMLTKEAFTPSRESHPVVSEERIRKMEPEVYRVEEPVAKNVITPPQFAAAPSAGTERERKVQTVIRLAREGWATEDIAAHVRMSVHQVRQMLGLVGQERRV